MRGTLVDEKAYLTDAFAREAVAFIERHQAEPFFSIWRSMRCIPRCTPADARLKRFEHIADTNRRTYAAMLLAMDEAVGQVLAKVRQAGHRGKHADLLFQRQRRANHAGQTINGSRNDPLRGSKRTTLEGGIRVPTVSAGRASCRPARSTHCR